VYPGRRFLDYALLGDDIIIADKKVADVYHEVVTKGLGVAISPQKSLVSDTGCAEFAKRFVVKGMSKDLSPISIRSLMGFHNPFGLMNVHLKYGAFLNACPIGRCWLSSPWPASRSAE
jgi:hypothetical protein